MNPQSFGKYQLLKKLATGGMAEVWLARQMGIEGFQKNLVVKRILPHLAEDREFVEMFRNEALIAARFNHPNIAQVYEFGEANGTYYIAMEYIHGEDLGRVMRKAASAGQWIARPLAIRIVADACQGLHYAHSRTDDAGRPLRVVHRDISPQNILISFDGSVKLVDFGIAKAADQASLTKSGAIKGKFAYMAPEQAAGKALDGRADIFAIGLVLYELLTGVRPLKRDSELATLQAAMECAIEPPSRVADVPSDMDPVVMRAVTKSADDRYRDARQFQTALEDILFAQHWAAGSVQISELMETLFADRLSQEKAQGQVLPVDDESSGSSGSPVPPTPPPQERGRSRPSSADMSWDAPPGESSSPRERGRSPAPRTTPPPPPRRTGTSAQPVVEEDPGEWDAPSGVMEVPQRRRGGTSDSMRRPSSANVTQVGRTSSRSDIRSADITSPGEPAPQPPPRRSMTRATPAVDVDAPPPPRSRSSVSLDLDERTRMDDDDEDDERTRLPPPEPAPPPRRRTGMQSQVSAPEAPPRRRTSSRAEMPSAPPPTRSRASMAAAPAVRPEDEVERAISDDSRRTRRTMATRNIATLGFIVGLLAVVAIFHKPILAVLNSTASDGQGVRLTINTNERVKVSVRHSERCGGAGLVTELGPTPLTLVSGAHLQDTLILENEQQGIYKEDSDTLAFGEPGQAKVLTHEFRRGQLQLLLKPDTLRGITVRRNGQEVGIYQGQGGSKGLKIELMEGKHKLELSGGPLKDPFIFEVDIKPNSVNRDTQDLSAFIG
ncbi:serine/threonine protein kinase [Myxococcus stipitatus DSM 14675]|uniref:Serine/threonine protein kinase n=1 Tax=Myxococcus stipitatus (strain DSM 14675 / JCM 12634 / Mx s8) TaxID=1278073 RepID=L7U847_MYXSD|nr:serine/threonine-protein kinase [Myxococcus stipitatus]AGC44293.1 serine/threonine protein kinase [Myxococcus stipitatus DSM 14675]